jgi:hypothetical protein
MPLLMTLANVCVKRQVHQEGVETRFFQTAFLHPVDQLFRHGSENMRRKFSGPASRERSATGITARVIPRFFW